MYRIFISTFALVTVLALPFSGKALSQELDLVILGGSVLDPGSKTEKVANIGISKGTITKISSEPLTGKQTIDAKGKTIAPGFIDLHTHTPFPLGETFQIKDGVTTSLDLEAGAFPVSAYGEFIKDNPRADYGASVAHFAIRIKVIEGIDQPYAVTSAGQLVPGAAFIQKATSAQVEEMRKLIQQGLDDGGLGIGVLLDYMSSAVTDEELRMILEVAAKNETVVWIHIRRGIFGDITPLMDIIKVSEEFGTKIHIAHINANAMGAIGEWLKEIDAANARGADITAEIFPYTAGSTSVSADVFDRDWETIFGITYGDVQWSETGEYFTKESWDRIRKDRPDSNLIHHYMKEEWLETALRHPRMMVASDAIAAISEDIKTNPNGAGTFTRLLVKYVREEKLLSLMDAVSRASFLPAERLAEFAPAFARKGRIEVGADADLLIFELKNLQDNATYTDPFKPSTGWDYVIVGGLPVVIDGEVTGAAPGKHIINQ